MIRIPPESPKVPPHIPPVPPKKGGEEEGTKPVRPMGPEAKAMGGRGPYELDSHSIAIRLAALAIEAREHELSFEEIIQRVIDETGMTNPQAALEEANKKLQEEIDKTLDEIKQNKELMQEVEAWQAFAQILEGKLSQDQVKEFLDLLGKSIREIS